MLCTSLQLFLIALLQWLALSTHSWLLDSQTRALLCVEFACPFCACMACILCRYYGFLQQSKDMHIRLIGSSQLVVGCFYVATFQNETPPLPADSCGRLQLHPVTLTAGELVTENDLKIKSFSYNDVALFGTKEPIRGLMSLQEIFTPRN